MVNGCPHCGAELFSRSGDGQRLVLPKTALVLHKGSGDVEVNCPRCKNGVLLPLSVSAEVKLRKGRVARPIVFKQG